MKRCPCICIHAHCCNPPSDTVNLACPFSCYEIQVTAIENLGSLQKGKQPLWVSCAACVQTQIRGLSQAHPAHPPLHVGTSAPWCAMWHDPMDPLDPMDPNVGARRALPDFYACAFIIFPDEHHTASPDIGLSEQLRENLHPQWNNITITYPKINLLFVDSTLTILRHNQHGYGVG